MNMQDLVSIKGVWYNLGKTRILVSGPMNCVYVVFENNVIDTQAINYDLDFALSKIEGRLYIQNLL